MKRKRFSVEQITGVLQQVEAGVPVCDVCRQVAVSEQTFYRWKKKYGGMLPSEAREMKQLREENTKLKRLVADLALDKVMQYLMGRYGREHPPRMTGREDDAVIGVLHEPEGSAHGSASAGARTGPGARPVRLSPTAGVAAARRLGHRQRALLSRVHRGRPGAPAEAPVAPRDSRPSRAATTSKDPPTISGAWILWRTSWPTAAAS